MECLYLIKPDISNSQYHRRKKQRLNGRQQIYLGRRCIDPLNDSERNYVVVSYHWHSPSGGTKPIHGYRVRSRDTQAFAKSKVKDVVLDRVLAYMAYRGAKLFWIDQECIVQSDSKLREEGLQSMNLVYSLSDFPVGLLTVRIEHKEEVEMLADLLTGKFVRDEGKDPQTLNKSLTPCKKRNVLLLLVHLTSDSWWTRAWTFHEDYLSGVRMILLIPHSPQLENIKLNSNHVLGSLEGQLCINSADFKYQTSEFCSAYVKDDEAFPHEIKICEKIMQTARAYKTLLETRNPNGSTVACGPMSSHLISDLGIRCITKPSDFLAIAANCCNYNRRLNITTLETSGQSLSLSLSILALYLLNGEIITNAARGKHKLPHNVYEFMKCRSLKGLEMPATKGNLTFLKICRLPSVSLEQEGIMTSGQLWMLGKIIDTAQFPQELPWEEPSVNGLDLKHRRQLRQLVKALALRNYVTLANNISRYLYEDTIEIADQSQHTQANNTLRQKFEGLMVGAIVHAIENRRKLVLGRLAKLKSPNQAGNVYRQYRAVFVVEPNMRLKSMLQSFVFTASDWKKKNETAVSLVVDWNEVSSRGPKLITKRWVNGMCFPRRSQRANVVFSWPHNF